MLVATIAAWLWLASLTLAGAVPREGVIQLDRRANAPRAKTSTVKSSSIKTSSTKTSSTKASSTSSVKSSTLSSVKSSSTSVILVSSTKTTSSASSTSLVADGACTNGPLTRSCWANGFSISTDFDAKSPPAGKTVTYSLEITNTTLNPDGAGAIPVMLINGQYPGPTIRASWGDTLVVNVKNSLANNGTGIHWHGVRQLNSCQHDGVPGVTECPIAPGKTRQYVFKCTQFGTSWYHSHFSGQYGAGVLGPLIIDGPATSNYDIDLGALPLSDWYYAPAFTLAEQSQLSTTGPPQPNNILVNGTHVNANGGGQYAKITLTKGKKHRIRLINTAVDQVFHVTADNHPFTVITTDFVPAKPWVTNQLTLQIGQRYDIIINANQTVDNYWFRVAIGACNTNSITSSGVQMGAILSYAGAGPGNPTSTTNVVARTTCNDEDPSNLVPFVPNSVPTSIVPSAVELDVNIKQDASTNNLFRWTVNGVAQRIDWSTPTLQTELSGSSDFGSTSNTYLMSTKSQWYLWYIENKVPFPVPHPIHLHGHDFYVLGTGTGAWDGTTTGLNFNNPPRRDTATMPAAGYLLVAFPADNPGLWIMHCHIGWHAGEGLSVQFLEQSGSISAAIGDTSALKSGCSEWNNYWSGPHPYGQTDSGL